ncbi:alpha/beta hydrolase [Desulfatiferula olefinivorans]
MHETTLPITFTADGYRLSGVLHLPDADRPPVVIGSHGLASDGDSPKQIDLARACTDLGLAYFRFHHRGCGTSEGFFPDVTSLENRICDLKAAADAVLSRPDTGDRLALFGSSMGGTTCLAASRDLPALGYVVVAAPVYGPSLTTPPERLTDEPQLDEAFYKRLRDFDIRPLLSGIRNILIFHGDKDEVVPIENGRMLFSGARDPKRMIVQKNGDHRISDPKHQKEFIREAALWLAKSFSG